MITCTKCFAEKPEADFHKDRKSSNGISRRCKECACLNSRKWNAENKNRKREAGKNWAKENSERKREIDKQWRQDNAERKRENDRLYCENNSAKQVEKVRQWRINNADRLRPMRAAEQARRRAAERKATPSWANKEMIDWLYKITAKYSEMTGVKHEVDHIVPLNGKRACGLHVESNLRIIPASENRMKSAKALNFNGAISVEWL